MHSTVIKYTYHYFSAILLPYKKESVSEITSVYIMKESYLLSLSGISSEFDNSSRLITISDKIAGFRPGSDRRKSTLGFSNKNLFFNNIS